MSMEFGKVAGTGRGERTSGLFASFAQDWTEWFGRCNWYNFTPVRVDIEHDRMMGQWVVHLALLGLHMELTYVYDSGPRVALMAKAEAMRASDAGIDLNDDEGLVAASIGQRLASLMANRKETE